MRVLQVNSSHGWSGGQYQVLLLSLGLVQRGHDVTIACPPGSQLAQRAARAGLDVFEIRMKKEYDLPAVFKLHKLMLERRIEVVNPHKPNPFSLASPAAAWAKVPVLVVSRRVSFPIGRNFFSRLKWKHYKIDGFIAVSDQIKRVLIDCNVEPERVRVIYSGTDVERFKPFADQSERLRVRSELGIEPDAPLIAKVATYFEWKGWEVFVRMAAEVAKRMPGVRFLGVGNRTPYLERLQGLASELGVAERIVFSEFRDDMPAVFAACDLTVNCAVRGEGLAGVLRESLAMHVPVVSSDAGGNSELVTPEVGLMFPRGDHQACAAKVIQLLEKPELRAQMGRVGRERVAQCFSDTVMIDRSESYFQELLDARRAKG
ncbi:MAG: glycosyltransferase family 4 protein [Candidatus Alcyoniella australis]|nr:glycosyltransferase family 4 protein [Candidatus Alcyoniella australis]